MTKDVSFLLQFPGYRQENNYSLSEAEIAAIFGWNKKSSDNFMLTLPFCGNDTTMGSETELQAAVVGEKASVDLPTIVEESRYYANMIRRTVSGDTPKKLIANLERFLHSNPDNVWENSYVRFPRAALSPFAFNLFRKDLRANKDMKESDLRSDAHKFMVRHKGKDFLRVPISYLLKLALADAVTFALGVPPLIQRMGYRLTAYFTNDNTSPETHSFHVVIPEPHAGLGKALAKDIARRFLLSQLLTMYANEKFLLKRHGQKAIVYFSPHPPLRQKKLNTCISDSFYRELFMSPCLSGWSDGETKHRYMHLCHEVLSRSHLHGVAKLREAGILMSNLAILPTISNTSLANNGTHVSLGSKKLSSLLQDPSSGFAKGHEKFYGDLAVKIFEHFLPLFVGTYSAAPYRFDFAEFHPEVVLGFLPHELDYTHLRMLWRRWKRKAKMKVLGQPLTPSGVSWLDRLISRVFHLKGDLVPDFRLIDYLVCLMSTYSSPALNGVMGNSASLKKDLQDQGVFHAQMSLYLLYKLREYEVMGFSGFEGRHYSLFEDFERDMGRAGTLQVLITALAFKYMFSREWSHQTIPDDPFVESERRQIIFGAALGVPTFYVRADTRNLFLRRIMARTPKIRSSRRYPGYVRVEMSEYRKALHSVLTEDGAPLIEMFGVSEEMTDLWERITNFGRHSVASRLVTRIVGKSGLWPALQMKSEEFNYAAERYYRGELQRRHIGEALSLLEEDMKALDRSILSADHALAKALAYVLKGKRATDFLSEVGPEVVNETASLQSLARLIHLVLLTEYADQSAAPHQEICYGPAPVYRAGNS